MAEQVSRKWKLTLLSMAFITLGFVACGFFPVLSGQYATYVMAILGAAGAYGGMNIFNKHVMGKHGGLPHQIAKGEEEETDGTSPAP